MNRISFLTGVFALGASLLPAAYQSPPAAGQQPTGPQLTFRVETNYIEVDAIVTDGRGNVVRDLKREDFTLFEDGKPQAVDAFAFVDIPFERADPLLHRDDEVDPDVFTNERDFEGRIYLIVLDSYHVAAVRTQQTRQVVRDFILNNVAANDSAAVVHVGRTDISQEFTSNKRLLLSVGGQVHGSEAAIEGPQQVRERPELRRRLIGRSAGLRLDTSASAMARATVASLGKLAGYMTGIQGRRKSVIFVSEGVRRSTPTISSGFAGSCRGRIRVSLATNSPREATEIGDVECATCRRHSKRRRAAISRCIPSIPEDWRMRRTS